MPATEPMSPTEPGRHSRMPSDQAGGTPVDLEVLDDAGPEGATDARAGANARTATEDSTAIAYIGELDSGATRTSLPITNQAGMLQVSPGASAVDLTRSAPGSDQIPDEVQPSGSRTFGRVIPSDTVQGAAAAVVAGDMGVKSVVAIDREDDVRETHCSMASIPSPMLPRSRRPVSRAAPAASTWCHRLQPIPILDVGGPRSTSSAPTRRSPVTTRDDDARGLDPDLGPDGAEPAARRRSGAQVGEEGRFWAYGYEAMAVVLDSIDRADDPLDRGSVIDAFFATTDRDSILGTYSIDDVGRYDAVGGGRLRRREPMAASTPAPEPTQRSLSRTSPGVPRQASASASRRRSRGAGRRSPRPGPASAGRAGLRSRPRRARRRAWP